jgi:YVTN family beta-propeller protein
MTQHLTRGLAMAFAGTLLLPGCPNSSAVPGVVPSGAGTSATLALHAIKQIPVGKTPHGMAAAGGFIYNANMGEGTISVIDSATDTVVKTVALANAGVPGPAQAFPDGKNVLILDTQNNLLLVIDPAQGHKIIQSVPLAQPPSNLTIDDDNKSVFVTTTGNQAYVLTFDVDRTKTPTSKNFPVGASSAEGRSAGFSGDFGAVPSNGDNNVQLINMDTGGVLNVSDGNQPQPVAIGKADDKGVAAIVGNFASSTVTIYQLPDGTKTTLTNVGLSPTDIALDADLHRAYLTMAGSNQVAVVDYLSRSVVGLVTVGDRPVHIEMAPVLPGAAAAAGTSTTPAQAFTLQHNGAPNAPLSHELWVGNDRSANVTVLDGATLRVKATIQAGNGHHKIAFALSKAYASNLTDNTVSVIDRIVIK